jgi:hypothetical protein
MSTDRGPFLPDELQALASAGTGTGLAGSRAEDEIAANAISLGERLYARKPKAFERRLRSYWVSWR